MKKLLSFFSLFFWLLICQDMEAILDGRTTSITIDYFYTFTNFEWARGHVKFNRGFDIPTNGTILLDVYDSIDGNIN